MVIVSGRPSETSPSDALETADVLFIDIVGYSKLPMDLQTRCLEELQTAVRASNTFQRATETGRLISLPTGDGMALAFFGDPLAGVVCAVEITRALTSAPHIQLRMGINSGPVYRIADINANRNVAGGGINMAQRVMDAGDARHILLSNAVADTLLQLSEWREHVVDLGVHPVKHGVKLHLFNLYRHDIGNPETPSRLRPPATSPPSAHVGTRPQVRLRALMGVTLLAGMAFVVWAIQRQARPDSPTPVAARPSVAVLPFVDMSPAKDQEYFADGLAEELLNVLAKIPDLRVAARTSSFQFKGAAGDIPVIGKRLNVEAILEGSVRKAGNRIRVTAQLIKVADGYHLWSETYDRELGDVLAVQDDIARSVATVLRVKLLEAAGVRPTPLPKADAYTLYLQGRYFASQRGRADLERALNYYAEALREDPRFAPAWVALADAHITQAGRGYVAFPTGFNAAREEAQRALALDDALPDAHSALATVRLRFDWDWPGAEASCQRALDLAPSSTRAMTCAAAIAATLGRFERALELYSRAVESDPLNIPLHMALGATLASADRVDEAEVEFRKALELKPDAPGGHFCLALVSLARRQPEVALKEIDKEPEGYLRRAGLAATYHALKRTAEADAALTDLLNTEDQDRPYAQIASVYAFRGDADKAFEYLERARRERDPGLTNIKGFPLLKSLVSDPRYNAFLSRMNLPI